MSRASHVSQADASPHAAATIPSQLDAVTVFRDGALVRRVARLPAGAADATAVVALGALPLALEDGSVRVRVRGAPRIATDVRVALDVVAPELALPPADDAALEAARREVAALEAEVAQRERELARIEAIGIVARPKGKDGEPPPPSPVEARLALLELRAAQEAAVRAELAALAPRLDDARRRHARLADRAQRASTARRPREHELRKVVVVALRPVASGAADAAVAEAAAADAPDTPDAAGGVLELEYLVPGARWAPAYVARVGAGRAALELRAVVAQRTGEDWRDVALRLSTADATRFTELPELSALRIGRRQPRPARAGWRAPPVGAEALFADYDRAFAGRGEPRARREDAGADDLDGVAGALDELARPAPERAAAPPVATAMPVAMFAAPMASAPMAAPMPGAPPSFGPPPAAPLPAPAPARVAMQATKIAPQAARARREQDRRGGPTGGGAAIAEEARAEAGAAADLGGAAFADDADAALAAPAALLDYGALRLAAPSAPARGRLAPASRRERLGERLRAARMELGFDVMSVVARATEEARAVAWLPLPPGHVAAWDDAFAAIYACQARVDVPSDGAFHGLPVAAADAAVAITHVVVPREASEVFRQATLESPLDVPLLEGPLDVYLGDDFLLTTRLPVTAPRGTAAIGLGVDQAVKVARNATFREEAAGLIRGSLLLRHAVEITVDNVASRAVDLEVRERVPLPRPGEEDVEVTVGEVAPPWEPWDPFPDAPDERRLRGGHRFRIRLEPGARRVLRYAYDVKIGGKQELVGGNRREP